MESRFNRHSAALIRRHGERVWRLGLDGGFGCPNREGGRGRGGCAYCAPSAARAPYLPEGRLPIAAQLEAGMDFLSRRYGAKLFFPYFQAYSSTNAPVEELRARYDEAFAAAEPLVRGRAAAEGRGAADPIRGLVVSTRPDCVDGGKAALLASYAARGLEVWVELGLQSSQERSLERLRRGHGWGAFARAFEELRAAGSGLRIAVHLILGLPGETRAQMLETIDRVSALGADGVKLHDLVLPLGSSLATEYLAGELVLLHPARLPALVADCLERLGPGCEVIRLGADAGADAILAPRRRPDKAQLYEAVEAELAARGTRQGVAVSRRLGYTAPTCN
jgi:uncharacterized protein